jgi:hypothetical protein
MLYTSLWHATIPLNTDTVLYWMCCTGTATALHSTVLYIMRSIGQQIELSTAYKL